MLDLLISAPISVIVSFMALAGVALHDTKIDKLATSLVSVGASSSYGNNSDSGIKVDTGHAHTHVERVHLSDTTQPRIAPRDEQKKHLMQKHEPRGKHRYDGYSLPLA